TQESVVNSFNQLRASRAVIAANKVAVDATALAAEGVKQENQVGTRTIIEVLNAEQERLNSEVNLVTARRDEQVAAYSLLASLGAAEAEALGVPVEHYDPTVNAGRVRHLLAEGGDKNAAALPLPVADRATRSLVIGPPKP
ncbi:MAG: TolC family protein, partial [Sandarakinorhabdus sp.]|nr:TolC family protein [Sandarakinorhabdus sp.]